MSRAGRCGCRRHKRFRRHEGAWVWVGGPVPPGSAAITLGRLVIVRRYAVGDERLMRHEMVHVRQWRELGVVHFLIGYLGGYFRGRWHGYGHKEAYRRVPLEVEAERDATATTGPTAAGRIPMSKEHGGGLGESAP